jgi:TonB family protein
MNLRAFALALVAGATLARGAPAFEVVEAVMPEWPAAQPRDQVGHVDVGFRLAGRRQWHVQSLGSDLPQEFVVEAIRSFELWLIEQTADGSCGWVDARVRFEFDGTAADPVQVSALEVVHRAEGAELPRLDSIEVYAGRVHRSIPDTAAAAADVAKHRQDIERARDLRWAVPPKVEVWIEPRYPREALESGIEGDIVLKLSIDAKGRVTHVEEIRSTEPRLFGGVAIAAARKWKIAPARDGNGDPVAAQACQMIGFRLWSVR